MRLATLVGMPSRSPRLPRQPLNLEEREIQFGIKLSRAKLAAVHAAGDAVGLATSAWVRTILRRAAGLRAV